MISNGRACQDLPQRSEGINKNLHYGDGLDQAVHECTGLCAAGGVGKKKVLAPDYKRLYTALRSIVADL